MTAGADRHGAEDLKALRAEAAAEVAKDAVSSPPTPAEPVSALAPLRDPRFRVAWIAFLVAQVVIWAQTVGAVDVISDRSGSATALAGIQTAISLPGLILAMFAGAVADVFDRKRLLLGAGLAMVVSMALLAVLTLTDVVTTAAVLVLTTALGAGLAMFLPAFGASVPDLVPRSLLGSAVAITNVSVNIARAVGPALAGLAIAVSGAGGLFVILAVVLAGVVVLLALRSPASVPPARPERITQAVRAGARYARYSAPLRRVVARTALFVLFGSALWAILPLIATRRLGLDSSAFGLLLGCVGAGAVAGAAVLPRIRTRLTLEQSTGMFSVLLAAVLAALAFVRDPVVAALILLVAGAAWISVLTGLLTAAQLATPAWVRGRALSAWLFAYQGGLAVGALTWGAVAETSLAASLIVPGVALIGTGLLGRSLPLPPEQDLDLEPVKAWDDPRVVVDIDDAAGPALITVEYEVDAADVDAFIDAITDLSEVRRRDGAITWHLSYDVAAPGRFLETFTVATWGEHLRQHERGTQVDLPLEQRVRDLTQRYEVRHFVSALR